MNRLSLIAAALSMAGLLGFAHAQNGSWGDVKGRVVWGGDAPKEQPTLDLKANPDKGACERNGKLPDEQFVINPKNKGMKNVFVWLEPATKGEKIPVHPKLKEVPKTKIEIDQPTCTFTPHAVAIRAGQVLVAKNTSPIAHNFKWSGDPNVNPGGNVLIPPGGAPKEIDDLKASRLPVAIECNIHPWMRGYVRVFDHPYFAVTDADGNFEIKNAPAGGFKLKVWQGTAGWLGGVKGKDGTPIAIKAGANDQGELKFPPPG